MTAPRASVRQLGISERLLTTTTLPDVLYIDAHAVEHPRAGERTAEQWARAIMDDVDDSMRERLTAAWAAIKLHLTPGSRSAIAGWHIASASPKRILLQANSALGFQGELSVTVTKDTVELATFVTAIDAQARDAWFRVVPAHLAFVQTLLEQAEQAAS